MNTRFCKKAAIYHGKPGEVAPVSRRRISRFPTAGYGQAGVAELRAASGKTGANERMGGFGNRVGHGKGDS